MVSRSKHKAKLSNKGFMLIECIISCAIISTVMLIATRHLIIMLKYYEEKRIEDIYYSTAENVYNLVTERMGYMREVTNVQYVSVMFGQRKDVTYQDPIEGAVFLQINGYFNDLKDYNDKYVKGSISFHNNPGSAYLRYSQSTAIVEYFDEIEISKTANSGIITIKYKIRGLDEVFYLNIDLLDKGLKLI
ncbi:MAG: hypothetical protein ATN31_04915 [Candidatus Epulonipiscioides saccharophilum]|nr:MAG: hypothetical protein ATN31_04915 [Epulopiscium sp. AS2M-Bin001]